MLTPTRFAVLAATLVLGLAIACEGDSSSGNSEGDVKRDVTNALNAIFGDDLDVAEFAKYSTTECLVDTAELALVFAFLGDADIEFEVDEVELLENERALVTIGGSGDFLEAFGGSAGGAEAELDLWVLQDGRCRNTSDCEDYDEERAAWASIRPSPTTLVAVRSATTSGRRSMHQWATDSRSAISQ